MNTAALGVTPNQMIANGAQARPGRKNAARNVLSTPALNATITLPISSKRLRRSSFRSAMRRSSPSFLTTASGVFAGFLDDPSVELVGVEAGGKGIGTAFLGEALEHLAGLGAKQTIIEWTTLVTYYAKHGFEVARRYQGYALNLD